MIMDAMQKARLGSLTPGSTRSLSSPKGVLRNKRLQLPSHVLCSLLSSHQAGAPEAYCSSQCCAEKRVVAHSDERGTRGRGHCPENLRRSHSWEHQQRLQVAGAATHTWTSTGSARMSALPSAMVLLLVASGSWLPASKLGCPAHMGVLVSPAGTSAEVQCKVPCAPTAAEVRHMIATAASATRWPSDLLTSTGRAMFAATFIVRNSVLGPRP